MLKLFDSLMRGYPIQTFLFWRTTNEIKARKFMQVIDWDADLHSLYDASISDKGKEKLFVLDGQQRLQSLYAIFNGSIQDDAGNREAWFDVVSGDPANASDIKFRLKFSATKPGATYYRLNNLLGVDNQKNSNALAKEINSHLDLVPKEKTEEAKENGEIDSHLDLALKEKKEEEEKEKREERKELVRDNVAQLVSLIREEKHFWIQTLDGVANDYPYQRILDIFVRVNSGGTKLDASDLMFAAMKTEWDEVEERIEDCVNGLNSGGLEFDKSVALKCITLAHGSGAELSPEKFNPGQQLNLEIKDQWSRAEAAFQQLGDFIANDLKIYSRRLIRSYNSFVVIFDYLYHNPKPDPINRARLKSYFYKSQLFNWFSSSTDGKLDSLHKIVGRVQASGFPLDRISIDFDKSKLSKEDLHTPRLRSLLLNLVYVETHGTGPFNVRFKDNLPQADHIYPKSPLQKRLLFNSLDVNHFGNFRFVGASDNNRKSAELPDSYFTRLKASGVDIEKHLLLSSYSTNPSTLVFDASTYVEFRDERFEKMWSMADKVVNL